ncbi:DNA protection protein UmuC [Escherichia coli]|nr:DNA protection protein UmuC [Escherichia coli]
MPYCSVYQLYAEGTSFRTPPLKPFTSTSRREGRTVSSSNGMVFSGSTLSHRRFHHTETSSLLQKSHLSPLLAVKCTVMFSLTSSGNPSQRRWPIPLCNQSSCSIMQFYSSSSTPFCRCVSQRVNAIFSGDTTPRPAAVRATEWQMKREMLSPAYTTRWNELPVARL